MDLELMRKIWKISRCLWRRVPDDPDDDKPYRHMQRPLSGSFANTYKYLLFVLLILLVLLDSASQFFFSLSLSSSLFLVLEMTTRFAMRAAAVALPAIFASSSAALDFNYPGADTALPDRIQWLTEGLVQACNFTACQMWDLDWIDYATLDGLIAGKTYIPSDYGVGTGDLEQIKSCWGVGLGELNNGQYSDDVGWKMTTWLTAADYYNSTGDTDTADSWINDITPWYAGVVAMRDDLCGGGIYWEQGHNYKATISNSLFLSVSARLYEYTGNTTYLDNAVTAANFLFQDNGVWDSTKGLGDGITANSSTGECSVSPSLFTYNQGVSLDGLVSLALTQQNTTYSDWATALVNVFMTPPTLIDYNGVVHEGGDSNSGGSDGQGSMFKGAYMNHFRTYMERLPLTNVTNPYANFTNNNAEAAWVAADATGSWQMSTIWINSTGGANPGGSPVGQWGGAGSILAAQVLEYAQGKLHIS
ncbi:MAG: hypothetical protein M1818_007058 [Claussenomyces sp. TS43310]|nr:MAG: hypothetical protein M1818_007058 [Claussenomyces sp. TS43310]